MSAHSMPWFHITIGKWPNESGWIPLTACSVLLAGKSTKLGLVFLNLDFSVVSSVKVLMELTAPIPDSL
mgnify:CR=1 FL=1